VTCTLWPKDPANHRLRVIPEAWFGAGETVPGIDGTVKV
jgi:hypothetical protein